MIAGSNNQAGLSSAVEVALPERRALFISHASPEDNVFTIWLGAKLSALGYEVWADVLRLSGGDDWERKLEAAIRDRACKVLLVANPVSVNKQGVRNELHIAADVARKISDNSFVIPLRLAEFNAPFLVAQAQYINFESNWTGGLQKLLKDLRDSYNVPVAGHADVALWTNLQLLHGKPVAQKPEPLISNWLGVRRLPSSLQYIRIEANGAMDNALGACPKVEHGDGVLLAGAATVESQMSISTVEFLQSGWPNLGISMEEARRLFTDLSNRALGNLFQFKGLSSFKMSNRQLAWWVGKATAEGRIAFNWPGVTGSRLLQGHSARRNISWHFGVSTAFRSRPFPHVRVKSRLVFTADGCTPISDSKRMHRLRRSFAKSWRNARWRDMMLAFLYWVGDGTTVLNVPCGSGEDLVLSLPPLSFSSPVSVSDASCLDEDSDDPDIDFSQDDEGAFSEEAVVAQDEEGDGEPNK